MIEKRVNKRKTVGYFCLALWCISVWSLTGWYFEIQGRFKADKDLLNTPLNSNLLHNDQWEVMSFSCQHREARPCFVMLHLSAVCMQINNHPCENCLPALQQAANSIWNTFMIYGINTDMFSILNFILDSLFFFFTDSLDHFMLDWPFDLINNSKDKWVNDWQIDYLMLGRWLWTVVK